ncbi:hypothetical protein AB0I35_30480 [Nocardia sp. NPDC050378]|uniref:hypothetical protein n=1 Tax=Nocardia sp. NPDC050378 TaxID=3155400 RepID=UPI00340AF775
MGAPPRPEARYPAPGQDWQWFDESRVCGAQVSTIAVFSSKVVPQRSTGTAASADYLNWVDPAQIVSTPDHERWVRSIAVEPTRRTLTEACVALHQAKTPAELEAWIDRRWIGGTTQLVELGRVEGPGGPIYRVGDDCTHRAHFARIFGLPLLAAGRTSPLPQPLLVFDRPECEGGPLGRWASLWRGMQELGLLDVDEHPESGIGCAHRRGSAQSGCS